MVGPLSLPRMSKLAQRITSLPESATIAMAKMSRELKAQGRDIISLSLGEPDFNTPEHIKAAAHAAIDADYSHYTPVPGYADVREAICRKFARDNNLHFEPNQIVMSTGAKQSVANAVFCLVDPGQEVILPAPFWVSYEAMVKLAQGVAVPIPTSIDQDYKISPEQLQSVLTEKSKLMIFSSPCNPSGSVYTKAELEALAEVIAGHPDLHVVSDEIYEHILFEGEKFSIGSIASIADRVITVNGLSKAYAMTGWRLGFMGASQAIAAACSKFQGQFTSATNSIAQRAVIAALDGDQSPTLEMREAFLRRRALLGDLLAQIPGLRTNTPEGAFYHFPDVSAFFGKSLGDRQIDSADDLCMYLLEEAGVGLVAGTSFGAPNCIRLSYAAADEVLVEAARRITAALAKLN